MVDRKNKSHYHLWLVRGGEIQRLGEYYPNQAAAKTGLRAVRNILTERCHHTGRCYSGSINRLRLDFVQGHFCECIQARPCDMVCPEHSWPADFKPPPRRKPDRWIRRGGRWVRRNPRRPGAGSPAVNADPQQLELAVDHPHARSFGHALITSVFRRGAAYVQHLRRTARLPDLDTDPAKTVKDLIIVFVPVLLTILLAVLLNTCTGP